MPGPTRESGVSLAVTQRPEEAMRATKSFSEAGAGQQGSKKNPLHRPLNSSSACRAVSFPGFRSSSFRMSSRALSTFPRCT